MRHLILIRHGESQLNARNREERVFCGQFDTPLTPRGREQARQAAEHLRRLDFVRPQFALSSPLSRAAETLQILLEHYGQDATTGPPAHTIERLPPAIAFVERSHGQFEGKTEDEAYAEHAAYRDDPALAGFMDHFHRHAPDGESLAVVSDRVWQEFTRLWSATSGDIILVSHYNPIRCLVGRALALSEEEILKLRVPNAVPIVLRWQDRYELLGWPEYE
jgi:2,3-bisphosphoglycerate-dependent phosphoglycerate mutase